MLIVLSILIGVFIGVGRYTFRYADGLSYFSADPKACANCHIMQPQYDSWQKSSHHAVASCIDCHLPHDLVGKYLAKAENGYHHSKAFTLQDFHEPIRIKEKNQRILQQNCVSCHSDMVDHLAPVSGMVAGRTDCMHCHWTVGHGPTFGIGGPLRPEETLDTARLDPEKKQ